MTDKQVPITKSWVEEHQATIPTPYHLYDERNIRENARYVNGAFSWVSNSEAKPGGFKNYFAVKALPNPAIMRLLQEEGMGFDCSSGAELALCERIGVRGEEIMFTSNDTTREEYEKAAALGAIINLDDISHIAFLEKTLGSLPELLCFRYNPGPLREGNVIIGRPEEAKYGFTRDQILKGYEICKQKGVKRFGLHTMVASNELDPDYFIETARMLFELAVEVKQTLGISIEFVNLGGGIGIPYKPEDTRVDLEYVSTGIETLYEQIIVPEGLHPLRIVMENGRMITGPYGYLVTRVLHLKNTYKSYVGLDASMANLMRPGMYGAYHHITVLGKEHSEPTSVYDVTGSLCENNDKFAIDRSLPSIGVDDVLVIHDTGAHGHSMGFNYNGKLRSAEVLLQMDGSPRVIRRKETLEDYFATLEF
ncbi:diaminopimelate decarboxylase [Spirochaeta lutea]|uniref:Diaminopimelate decarboxylase n=1 Tax=Spirochaeta lutea TaxID=1480694 RepID=A0A098QWJ8_9SPIO|nr:diaminopimelate decarboxylase [Spirochaeta lutea]KGE71931.1 diaminopimelate decarboxylase [Spirochaeta lutea]